MRNEAQIDNKTAGGANERGTNTCPNCGTRMPLELRFCRACGCRLGEGVEEYTETVRLGDAASTARNAKPRTARTVASQTSSFGFKSSRTGAHDVQSVTSGFKRWRIGRACSRMPRWMLWVIIPLMAVIITDGFKKSSVMVRRNRSRNTAAVQNAPTSYLGSHYTTTDGGVLIEDVSPPDSAADKAGLIGGDVIKSFDGKPVKEDGELSELLSQTPAGKTIEVVYVRDGETKTAKVTTVSEDENRRLEEAFENRREGRGRFGFDDDDTEVVPVPGTNVKGVRLDDITDNLPADMAGVREGDVVIQFDKTPIRTVRELVSRIHRAIPYSTINLVVMRGDERLEIPVKIGKQ